jgi:capsular polysaccharide biosynthesis protein
MIYGHGLPEGFATILKFLEQDPTTFFILDCPWMYVPENFYFGNNKNKLIDEANTPFNKFLFEFLDSKNVDYIIFGKDELTNKKNPKIIANKINIFQQNMPFYRNIRLIGNAVDYLRKPETEPYKRVYLSRRSWSKNRDSKLLYAQYLTLGDFRIDDEKKVEDFLAEKHFEICYPEDFKDFRDQIRYFDLTKTLCTATGSGMFNQIFMRPGGNIIELSNPMINNGIEMIHGHGQAIAWGMNHFYVSISHKKSADEIIDKLTKYDGLFGIV